MAFGFTSPVKLDNVGGPGIDAEPPQVARSGDKVLIVWHEFPDLNNLQPDVFVARGTNSNQGLTFGQRINLSESGPTDSRDERIAVTRSGSDLRIYVVWIEDPTTLRFRRDRTNDGTYANAITINDTVGNVAPSNPQIAADGDNVYVVWQAQGQNNMPDIYFARSKDSGDSFEDKKNISSNDGTSEAPQLAVLGNKQVVVTWRDDSLGNFEIVYVRGKE